MKNLLILLSPRYKKLRHRIEKPGAERKRLAIIVLLVVGSVGGSLRSLPESFDLFYG